MSEYDDFDNDKEPSFSMGDFKKWLSSQRKIRESVDRPTKSIEKVGDQIKEAFKEKMRRRVSRNVEKKLRDKKSQ